VIGVLDIGKSSPEVSGARVALHASHPYSSTHALLATSDAVIPAPLYFVPLDLRFITSSGTYLSLLASKSTQLQILLRYIGQVQRSMQAEWRSAQELPHKFIRNVDEELRERSHCDFINAAYHLVVTGNCYAPMKEWLVDELAERVRHPLTPFRWLMSPMARS
jgi:anaphase-promoting complex subunit 4